MGDDVSIPGPDDGGQKLFGLPMPLVLIGGGGLLLLFLFSATRKSGDTSGMVPLSTAVQLGDIQQRQLEIMGGLGQGFNQMSKEHAKYAKEQMDALSATETHLSDQLKAMDQSLADQFKGLGGQISANQQETLLKLAEQREFLFKKLEAVQQGQDYYYKALQGDISESGLKYYQGLLDQLVTMEGREGEYQNMQWNWLTNKINELQGRGGGPPAASPWESAYASWRANFGKTGDNPYDLNADKVVDIRDYGILRQRFGI